MEEDLSCESDLKQIAENPWYISMLFGVFAGTIFKFRKLWTFHKKMQKQSGASQFFFGTELQTIRVVHQMGRRLKQSLEIHPFV